MTESEFLQLSDAIFDQIEAAIDDHGLDADTLRQGNVLEIEFDSGEKVIVNRHAVNQELWIAAKSGGYHFSRQGAAWIASRDGSEFFATLAEAIRAGSGEAFGFGD
ncbi:iron donor protein CyaY [Chromobacterium subtsugae]|uniref:Iron-sulfur cluster assembly protein CyaY n=1 Tax=Chromobacterium subtsugae TaxID=251747 RepID=A0ABS7F7R2_9NEIS|nr:MULTISPECIES: iron donor protein CyaY [Chromobacterium]KUM02851.1 iron donor protein CyaY [Chromobacterium subtsugae]KZE83203.1 iron donor protein CyaY [Chromobacterium sp. F49]MBW7567163.1 iron donor protein CyaY [Chromobacterium subtsugae]MBW8286133.1 iron donor protein CyaY [Chromobacterium subtsugae]OBU87947.1 protein CyaY [Chromobacterium subtsugae]